MNRRFPLVLITAAIFYAPSAMAATCDSLAVLPLQNAHITSAQAVAAGAFTVPAAPAPAAAAAGRDGAAAAGGGARGGARGPARGGGRGGNQPNPYAMLPAFCRVAATLTPSSDSDIRIEVWLPDTGAWNGKFQAVGNGGGGRPIADPPVAAALAGGDATTSAQKGHGGNTPPFAPGQPGKLIDLPDRAPHEMRGRA